MTVGAAGKHDTFCVIIPAHNEESVVGRCLAAFLPGLRSGEASVVVVPNGCTDRTEVVARQNASVDVVVLTHASKSAALNAGDSFAVGFPRIYLDADIVVSAETLRALADALSTPGALVAAPRVEFAVEGRPWAVRAFYDIYRRLPYVADGLIGLGMYGLSSEGRKRFESFPPVTADDLFIQQLFEPAERTILDTHSFVVETPRTTQSLIAVRTRTAFGNAELHGWSNSRPGRAVERSTDNTLGALAKLLRRSPRLLPAVAVYSAVTIAARMAARRRSARNWQRDDTTRADASEIGL
jgi:glycosyltransferase involved in cell wall biosynthesis